jgi:transcriptional regulator with XRE-family HTH domain
MTADPVWFGPRLKELREAAGLKQHELAERAGLKKAGIANLEQGRTRPHWDTVVALCRALAVSCDAFMLPPTEREPPGPGRPAKPKDEAAGEKPKRPRGRPRKQEEAERQTAPAKKKRKG